jgi:hypothetical protein
MRIGLLATWIALVVVLFFGAGCEERPPLVVLEWRLPPGDAGVVDATFITNRSVFREPFMEDEIGSVFISDVATGRSAIIWTKAFFDPTNLGKTVEALSDRRFRMTIDTVPSNFPPPPYRLDIGVRGGDGPDFGWPTFIGTVDFGAE